MRFTKQSQHCGLQQVSPTKMMCISHITCDDLARTRMTNACRVPIKVHESRRDLFGLLHVL